MEIVKLYPECKDNIWGGVKLREKYGKQTDKNPVAESWELSFHKDGPTRLADGKTLQEVATEADLGGNCGACPFFPMLAKFIDAKQDLSVQVHPSDEYALEHENSFGKTETWYIVDADENAGILPIQQQKFVAVMPQIDQTCWKQIITVIRPEH